MSDRASRSGWAGWLALAGVAFVLILAPLVPGRESAGSIPLDTIILTVPIAILLAVPLLTRSGRLSLPRIGIEVPALAFLGWALVSAIMTGAQPSSIATWVRYASYVLLVYAVAAVAVDETRRRIMFWLLALAGSITVGHGFWQYVNPTTNIGMQGLDTSVATRVFATFDNPNFYAEFLVLVFAVTLALVFAEKGVLRYVAAVLLVAQAMALLLTYTRGSWLALALGLGIGILMIDGRLIWPFALGAAALIPFVPGALARVLSIFSLEGTASFRLILWRVAGDAISSHPVFGVGLGHFYDAFTEAVLSNSALNIGYLFYGAHQSYFQIAAETGIPGGLAFAWMIFEGTRMGGFYNARMGTDLRERLTNAALTAGLIAFAVNALTSNAFQHPRGAVFFYVLAGLQAGLGAKYWTRSAQERARTRNTEGIWARSLVGRGYAAIERGVAAMWRVSVSRWILLREPAGGGTLLAQSLIAGSVIGDGQAPVPPAAMSRK